jgi:hypothetical protein
MLSLRTPLRGHVTIGGFTASVTLDHASGHDDPSA